MNDYRFDLACDVIWDKVSKLDQMISETEPFKLIKTDKQKAIGLLSSYINELASIAKMLEPILPITSIKILESTFGVKLTDKQKLEMPVFINEEVLSEYRTFESLYADSKVKKDLMFLTSLQALNLMADLSVKNEAKSERTGEYIHITSRRFKYSKGTNLYRRGISGVSLAYALDHSDTQHVGVYTENTVEAADIIDQSMATALAPLAQAFAGTLIESEKDAIRANDPHSRVKNEAHNSIGNCGTHDFCTSGLRACYTCVKFQPWKDAPHREVRDFVLEERERQLNAGVSKHAIESSDRLLLAVEQVIQMCDVKTGDNAYE
jgi:hypothetical protein